MGIAVFFPHFAIGFVISVFLVVFAAGWSSLVARQAHNLKVAGSNPAPATNYRIENVT